jgi:hypothetical protein
MFQRCILASNITVVMLEAVCTSEISVYSETTRRYIPEGSNLHTHCHEDLKSRIIYTLIALNFVTTHSMTATAGNSLYRHSPGYARLNLHKFDLMQIVPLGTQRNFQDVNEML